MYFNFLLNKPKDSEIIADTARSGLNKRIQPKNEWNARREELSLLKENINISNNLLNMQEKFSTPKINGFLQLGTQSSEWKFNSKSAYYITGLQVDMPLFNGKRNIRKVKQAKLDVMSAGNKYAETEALLQISQSAAWNGLETASANLQAARKQDEAASAYQRLIDKGFREGVNTYLETLDARNQVIQSRLLVNINQYRLLIAEALLEREQATFPLENK